MDLLVVETLEADVLEWLGLRHSIRHAPELAHVAARVPPLALQRPGDDRPGLGDDRRRDPRFRAGAAGDRPGQRRRREHRSRRLRAAPDRGRAQPHRRAPGPRPNSRSARRCRCCAGCRCATPTAASPAASSAARPSAWSACRRRRARSPSCFPASAPGSSATTRRCTPATASGSSGRWCRWACASCSSAPTSSAVQLAYFSRYHGLLGDRFLTHCKPSQVLVSTAHSGLFDETALAAALKSGRIAAAWFDSLEPGALDPRAAAARHPDAAGHAARRRDHARGTPAQRLGGRAADRRAARVRAEERQRAQRDDDSRRAR